MTQYPLRRPLRLFSGLLAACLILLAGLQGARAQQPASASTDAVDGPLVQVGPGDVLNLSVYGQPDMSGALTVNEDGTISVPLVGSVQVSGQSLANAGKAVEGAFRDKKMLVEPHVTLTMTEARSQRVSVLGEVGKPGRYSFQTNASVLDLLAQAGGITSNGGDMVVLLHPQKDGSVARQEIKLAGLSDTQQSLTTVRPTAGDTLFVPKAEQFYIYGQVTSPNMYRMETGMTLIQAIARAGGVTARGSEKRVEIKRTLANGKVNTFSAKPFDVIQPNDVIRVKESIF